MFSEEEQKVIQEKLEQLNRVKEKILSPHELAGLIAKRRVQWLEENLGLLLAKYGHLPPEEQAFNIIFLEHLRINPEHLKMTRICPNKIRIDSYNPCPYLEACQQLGLETKFVCKHIGEPAFRKMVKRINPNLRFTRNYRKIRPGNAFCEEYIEVVKNKKERKE